MSKRIYCIKCGYITHQTPHNNLQDVYECMCGQINTNDKSHKLHQNEQDDKQNDNSEAETDKNTDE